MSFSYAGGVITQANTATQTVTAVASGGAGFLDLTVASSASYAAGDLVEVTGTTSYNGVYLVDSIPNGTTIRIPDTDYHGTQNAFGSSQSGTIKKGDKDLSGLSAISTLYVTTNGASKLIVYSIGSARLDVTGTLLITPNAEALHFRSTATANELKVSAAGQLIIEGRMTSGGVTVYTSSPWALCDRTLTSTSSDADAAVYVLGKAYFYGSNHTASPLISFESGSFGYFESTRFIQLGGALFRMEGTFEFGGDGLRTVGCRPTMLMAANTTFEGFSPDLNYFDFGIAASGYLFTFINTDDSRLGGRTCSLRNSALVDFINTEKGILTTVSPFNAGVNSGNGGEVRQYKELSWLVKDTAGANLDGVKIYGINYNDGNRFNHSATWGAGYNFLADKVYTWTTAGGGLAAKQNILLQAYGLITTNGADTVSSKFTKAQGQTFDFFLYKYGKLPQTRNVNLSGTGELVTDPVMVADVLITEATKATVDAYTNHDTARKIYDAICSEFEDNYFTEAVHSDLPISRAGNQIVSIGNRSMVISSLASGRTLTASLYTLQATTYADGFDDNGGTGIFTVQGATSLSGGRFDSDVSYQSSATTLTDVTCTGVMDFTIAGTYTLDGCTINEVTNSSGGAVTLILINGATVAVNTGPSITVLNSNTLTLTSLKPNSEVRIYTAGTTTEIAGIENSGTSFSTSVTVPSVDIVIFAIGYLPIRSLAVDTTANLTLPIQQVFDRNYINP